MESESVSSIHRRTECDGYPASGCAKPTFAEFSVGETAEISDCLRTRQGRENRGLLQHGEGLRDDGLDAAASARQGIHNEPCADA